MLSCGRGLTSQQLAWELVCVPNGEGGLGLRSMCEANKAAIPNYNWNLFTKIGSVLVAT